MKKYFLFLCVFVILSACTNTIGYLPDDEPKKTDRKCHDAN